MFGVLREGHAYSAPCRSFAGGPYDNRIIWYFVDDDAPLYEGISAFEPQVDGIYDLKHETMEMCALKPVPRKHYSGRDIWFRDADGVIGDDDDFAGLATADKCKCHLGPPNPPCVTGPHAFNEIGLGGRLKTILMPIFKQGLNLGGVLTLPPVLVLRGGLALGDVRTFIAPPPIIVSGGLALGGVLAVPPILSVRSGFALGGVLTIVTPPAIALSAGLGLGGVLTFIPPPPITLSAGLALGGMLTFIPPPSITLSAGLALGGVLTFIPPPPITLSAGLALGGVLTFIPAPPITLSAGLALGGVIESPTGNFKQGFMLGVVEASTSGGSGSGSGSNGGGGGSTCETALNMDSGVDYTTDVIAGDPDDWFKFWLPAGSSCDVAYKTNTGGNRSMTWYHGSCLDLVLIRGTFEELITFPYGPAASSEWVIGVSNNSFAGTGNYTLRITLS